MLYFVSGKARVNAAECRQLGLGYAMEGDSVTSCGVGGGPDGSPGVVFAFGQVEAAYVRYAKPAQTWETHEGVPGVHLGFWHDQRPGPEMLARRRQLSGHFVRLGDGGDWQVPAGRPVGDSPPLPRKLRRVGGHWEFGDVAEEYQGLFSDACKVMDNLLAIKEGENQVSIDEGAEIAARALAVNYRLGPAEISVLGLLDTGAMREVLLALVDWEVIADLAKKALAEPPGSAPSAAE